MNYDWSVDMKLFFLFVTLLWSAMSWSGEPSYVYDPNDYDQSTGLLIIPITATTDKDGLISSYEQQITKNLFIYDPSTKKGRKLFDKFYGQVTGYILESSLTKDGEIEYLGTSSGLAKNNQQIKVRPIRSTMLIETFNNSTRRYTVWKSEKLTGSPEVMFSYTKPSSWHIDSRMGIIRLVVQEQENILVKEYTW
jgi:hypothetical protein